MLCGALEARRERDDLIHLRTCMKLPMRRRQSVPQMRKAEMVVSKAEASNTPWRVCREGEGGGKGWWMGGDWGLGVKDLELRVGFRV